MQNPIAALGPAARSVWAPALLSVLLAVAGVIGLGVVVVDYAGNLDTDAFAADEPSESRPGTRRALDDLGSVDDLTVVGLEDERGEVRGDLEGAELRQERQSVAAIDALGDTIDPFTVVLLALIPAAAVLQSWWLARAYRCLRRRHRRTDPRTAYRPVRVILLGTALSTGVYALGLGPWEDEPGAVLLLSLVVGLVVTVAWIRALLAFIDMIGDVTFSLLGGHYGTARLMRFCLKGWLWLYGALLVTLLSLVLGAGTVAVVAASIVLVGLFLLPIVFVMTYVVAVIVATMAVDQTLDRAADQLASLDRSGRLRIGPRPA